MFFEGGVKSAIGGASSLYSLGQFSRPPCARKSLLPNTPARKPAHSIIGDDATTSLAGAEGHDLYCALFGGRIASGPGLIIGRWDIFIKRAVQQFEKPPWLVIDAGMPQRRGVSERQGQNQPTL